MITSISPHEPVSAVHCVKASFCPLQDSFVTLNNLYESESGRAWPHKAIMDVLKAGSEPLLSSSSVLLLSTAFTTSYLSSIYLLPSTRVSSAPPQLKNGQRTTYSPTIQPLSAAVTGEDRKGKGRAEEYRDRNHPAVIKARLTAISVSTTLSCAVVPFILAQTNSAGYAANGRTALQLLGLAIPATATQAARSLLLPLGLTASLFSGSIYIAGLRQILPGQERWSAAAFLQELTDWRGIRTYIVVRGPAWRGVQD